MYRCEHCGATGRRHFTLPHPDARAAQGGGTVECPNDTSDDLGCTHDVTVTTADGHGAFCAGCGETLA